MWKGKESLQNILVWLVPSLFVFLLSFSFIYLSYLDKDFYKLFILTFLAAGLGAGIPAWLVWYLTINREEKKRQEDEKNALIVEYSKCLYNLSNSVVLYNVAKREQTSSNKTHQHNSPASRSLDDFTYLENDYLSLLPVDQYFAKNEKEGDMKNPVLTFSDLSKNIANRIVSANAAIIHAIKTSSTSIYQHNWTTVHSLSIDLVVNTFGLLERVSLYLDVKYGENYLEKLSTLGVAKEAKEIYKEYQEQLSSKVNRGK